MSWPPSGSTSTLTGARPWRRGCSESSRAVASKPIPVELEWLRERCAGLMGREPEGTESAKP